jgi:hypothetical protein
VVTLTVYNLSTSTDMARIVTIVMAAHVGGATGRSLLKLKRTAFHGDIRLSRLIGTPNIRLYALSPG